MKQPIAIIIACCGAAGALAHEGHGLQGPHWHATDAVGFLLLAALVALGVWWFGRK